MKSYGAGLLTQVGAAGTSLEAAQVPATHKALPSLPEFGGLHPQHRDKARADHTAVCMRSLQSTNMNTASSPQHRGSGERLARREQPQGWHGRASAHPPVSQNTPLRSLGAAGSPQLHTQTHSRTGASAANTPLSPHGGVQGCRLQRLVPGVREGAEAPLLGCPEKKKKGEFSSKNVAAALAAWLVLAHCSRDSTRSCSSSFPPTSNTTPGLDQRGIHWRHRHHNLVCSTLPAQGSIHPAATEGGKKK